MGDFIPSFTVKQLRFLKNENSAYGELLKTREGRSKPRPIATRSSMHLVLRSSKAKGEWSFRRTDNAKKINAAVSKFSNRFGVKILSLANVGNHLHFHLQFTSRQGYRPFIRALTAAIAMAVSGVSRWNKKSEGRFWDYRPFTRIIQSWRGYLNLKDYVRINQLEGAGVPRTQARFLIACWDIRKNSS